MSLGSLIAISKIIEESLLKIIDRVSKTAVRYYSSHLK
jgi:hypothetical protein